jgi:hypothetical protein
MGENRVSTHSPFAFRPRADDAPRADGPAPPPPPSCAPGCLSTSSFDSNAYCDRRALAWACWATTAAKHAGPDRAWCMPGGREAVCASPIGLGGSGVSSSRFCSPCSIAHSSSKSSTGTNNNRSIFPSVSTSSPQLSDHCQSHLTLDLSCEACLRMGTACERCGRLRGANALPQSSNLDWRQRRVGICRCDGGLPYRLARRALAASSRRHPGSPLPFYAYCASTKATASG